MGATAHERRPTQTGMMGSALEHEPAGWDMIVRRRVRTARSERPVCERCTVSSSTVAKVCIAMCPMNVSPIFLVRSSEGHSAGSREQVWSASVGRVRISAWGLGLVVGVERKNWPRE